MGGTKQNGETKMSKAVVLFLAWNLFTFLLGNLFCFAILIGVVGIPITSLISDFSFLGTMILGSGLVGWLFLGGAKSLEWGEGENQK